MPLLRRSRPEVVLCDLGLPGMDGYAVAAALRQVAATSGARLIAVTGYGQEEDQQRAHEAGFDMHLTKPVGFAELQRFLETGTGEEHLDRDRGQPRAAGWRRNGPAGAA